MSKNSIVRSTIEYKRLLDRFIDKSDKDVDVVVLLDVRDCDTIGLYIEEYRGLSEIEVIDSLPEKQLKMLRMKKMDCKFAYTNVERDSLQDHIDAMKEIENKYKGKKIRIIMNPPFKYGGEIFDEALLITDDISCLIPFGQLKRNNRVQRVDEKTLELADPRLFPNAMIGDNLCIFHSNKERTNKNYSDLQKMTFDPNFIKFYEWNMNSKQVYVPREIRNVKYSELNIDTEFIESNRCCARLSGGGFGKNGLGYSWNMGVPKTVDDKTSASIDGFGGAFILNMKSKKEKTNFTEWWYSYSKGNGLSSKAQLGLGIVTVSSVCSCAIPQIDWEAISDHDLWKQGLYDEAVLDVMGLKWNEDRTGVIGK